MAKIRITAGAFSCDVSGDDFEKMRLEIGEFIREFEKMPGFELPGKKSKSKKSQKSVENYSQKTEICNPEMLTTWLQAVEGNHAEEWISKHCPYPNAIRILRAMVRRGEIVKAETPYTKSNGNTGYMQAHYLAGENIPKPWPDTDPAVDDRILLTWLFDNPGYTPNFVEKNCGVPPKFAKKALTRLIVSKKVVVRKSMGDGKGRVHVVQTLKNKGDK